jgi:hypothetical protein
MRKTKAATTDASWIVGDGAAARDCLATCSCILPISDDCAWSWAKTWLIECKCAASSVSVREAEAEMGGGVSEEGADEDCVDVVAPEVVVELEAALEASTLYAGTCRGLIKAAAAREF